MGGHVYRHVSLLQCCAIAHDLACELPLRVCFGVCETIFVPTLFPTASAFFPFNLNHTTRDQFTVRRQTNPHSHGPQT